MLNACWHSACVLFIMHFEFWHWKLQLHQIIYHMIWEDSSPENSLYKFTVKVTLKNVVNCKPKFRQSYNVAVTESSQFSTWHLRMELYLTSQLSKELWSQIQLNIIIRLILRNLHVFVTVCVSVRLYVPRTRRSNVQETSTSSRSSGPFASSWLPPARPSSSEGSPPWTPSPCRHGRWGTVICRPIAAHHSSSVFSLILDCK